MQFMVNSYCFQKRALHGEEELLRGRTKLRFALIMNSSLCNYCSLVYNELQSCLNFSYSIYRQAGKQIQGVIRSAYKIERQAGGMQIFSPKAFDIEYIKPI